jgi:hypothetical protein
MTLRMERYGNTRYWAVYEAHELVVVTVYRRGALEVLRRPPRAHRCASRPPGRNPAGGYRPRRAGAAALARAAREPRRDQRERHRGGGRADAGVRFAQRHRRLRLSAAGRLRIA